MEASRLDPWKAYEQIQREMSERFRAFFEELARAEKAAEPICFSPVLDVYPTERGLAVRAALPGLIPDDIDIYVEGGVLTIRGEREAPTDASPDSYLIQEWAYGRFERAIALPFTVNEEDMEASYTDGVLLILLPRA